MNFNFITKKCKLLACTHTDLLFLTIPATVPTCRQMKNYEEKTKNLDTLLALNPGLCNMRREAAYLITVSCLFFSSTLPHKTRQCVILNI